MSAIESLRDRLAQSGALRIIDDHRCPRHRLKSNPMQTDRAAKCNELWRRGLTQRNTIGEASDEFIQSQSVVAGSPCRYPALRDSHVTFWNKGAVAFIEINRSSRRARFEAIVARFLPEKSFVASIVFGFRFQFHVARSPLTIASDKILPSNCCAGVDSKNAQNRWRKIDIACWVNRPPDRGENPDRPRSRCCACRIG